jgi:ElaB/YqjD/DUF883 family membrane-anchored ribosome-binding protein
MDAQNTMNNISDEMSRSKEQLRETAGTIKTELSRAGRLAAEAGREQISDMTRRGSEQVDRMADYVRDNPMSALGLAAGAGFLVALMMRRY